MFNDQKITKERKTLIFLIVREFLTFVTCQFAMI